MYGSSRRGSLRTRLPVAAALAWGIASTTFGGASRAAPIEFAISDVDVSFSGVDNDNCVNNCVPTILTPTPIVFDLDGVGDMEVVDLFSLVFTGSGGQPAFLFGIFPIGDVGAGSVRATVTTDITFSSPSGSVSDPVTGSGRFVTSLLGKAAGIEYSTRSTEVAFSDGTVISLNFPDRTTLLSLDPIPSIDILPFPDDDLNGCLRPNCAFRLDVSTNAVLERVPEPGVLMLLGAGLVVFGAMQRRRSASVA